MQLDSTASMIGASRVERLLIMRTFPGLENLPADDLAGMSANMRERFFGTGQHLFEAGGPVTRIYFIVEGEVAVRRDGKTFRTMGARSSVGALPAFARRPHGHDAVATRDTLTLEIAVDVMLEIFEDNFRLLRRVLQRMAGETLDARLRLGDAAGFSNVIEEQPEYPDRPLDLVERMWALRSTMTFVESRLDAIADLAADVEEVRLPAGTLLWDEGDQASDSYIIIAGVVECASERVGQRFRFGPGDGIGTLDGTARVPRWYRARVTQDLVALRISSEALNDVFEDNFDMALDLLEGLADVLLRLYEAGSEAD